MLDGGRDGGARQSVAPAVGFEVGDRSVGRRDFERIGREIVAFDSLAPDDALARADDGGGEVLLVALEQSVRVRVVKVLGEGDGMGAPVLGGEQRGVVPAPQPGRADQIVQRARADNVIDRARCALRMMNPERHAQVGVVHRRVVE